MENRPPSDLTVSLALGGLATTAALALLLRYTGDAAAFLTGRPAPTGGPAAGLGVLAHPTDPGAAIGAPGLNPFLYWALVILALGGLAALGVGLWRLVRRSQERSRVHSLTGSATGEEIARVASRKPLQRRASTLRPSIQDRKPDPKEVGYLLGSAKGTQVWATVEDSMLLIGPPRSGKGLHIVVNSILDAAGPVLTTSTWPDNLTVTLKARQRKGPVAVFDPQHLAPGLPAGMRWSIVRGCADPLTAMIRSKGLATATGFGGVSDGGFWVGKTTAASSACCTPPRWTGGTPRPSTSGH